MNNLPSCSWLGSVMMTLFPSEKRPVVGKLLPVLQTCLKVVSVWVLRAALLYLCFLSDIGNKPSRVSVKALVNFAQSINVQVNIM